MASKSNYKMTGDPMNYKSIGKNIQNSRNNLKLTQETLAEMANLSVSYIGALERGEKLPKLKAFIDIANALKVSSDALLTGVLKVSNEVVASDLSNKLSHLSPTEQRRILHVIEIMINDRN